VYGQRRNLIDGQRAQLGETQYRTRLDQLSAEQDADTHALRLRLTADIIRRLERTRG